jgi:DNA repair exonuclease SbcCD ATPase subunit
MEEKMFRACVIILILQLGFLIHGCTTLEYINGSSKEELKTFKMPKYEMMNEMEKIRAENVNLQRQIDILNTLRKEKQRIIDENEGTIASIRDENQLLNEQIRTLKSESQRIREENESRIAGVRGENENELARLREKNQLLNEQIRTLKSESQRIREENESRIAGVRGENENELARLREKNELLSEQIKNLTKENQKVKYENKSLVKILTRQKETLSSQSNALKKYIQKLKIKVLSIDSKNSAEKMAKKLNEIGYDIKSVVTLLNPSFHEIQYILHKNSRMKQSSLQLVLEVTQHLNP